MLDDIRNVDDPAALRALAHPLRLRLLASLRTDGPATASELGRRLGESSGSTSFHVRTLARYGFVVEDEERGTKRERWWRAVERGTSWSLSSEDRGQFEAGLGLARQQARFHAEWLQRFLDEAPRWSPAWQQAAELRDRMAKLTPERLTALGDEVWAVVERYAAEPSTGDDAQTVMIAFDAVPHRSGETAAGSDS